MKYLEQGGFKHHPLMRLTLLWSLVFLTGLWFTNTFMYFQRMDLTPQSVQDYYLGSQAEFSAPRSYASMMEVTHSHLPVMAIVILLLTHLMIFAPYSDKTKTWFISVTFFSALLGEGSGWLVRFVHPGFAPVKIISFLTFQACLAFLLTGLASYLLRRGRSKR